MALENVKKSDVDEVSFDEKVLLITQTLNWFAVRQEKIYQQFKRLDDKREGLPADTSKFTHDAFIEKTEFRNKILSDLTAIMEEWGNVIDGNDSLDQVDSVVTEAAYDVIYDRFQQED